MRDRLGIMPLWLDVWTFERTLSEAMELLREADEFVDYGHLMAVAEKALGLYDGAFMADENLPLVLAARESWRVKFVRFAVGVARFLTDTDRRNEAIVFLDRSLEADDVAEGLYRQLMLCYQQIGQRAEAVEVFNRCRTTLSSRLDLEPSPETCHIYEQVTVAG